MKQSMVNLFLRYTLSLVLGLIGTIGLTQNMKHPVIWASEQDRQNTLQLIAEDEWAAKLYEDLREIIDEQVKDHQADRAAILMEIPEVSKDDNLPELEVETVHDHTRIMTYASYAGLLYYLTEEEAYAKFAADILWYYAEKLAPRPPQKTSICGNTFYDARTTYSQFHIAYDFIYNYLKAPNTKVYSASQKAVVKYDHTIMQRTIENMVGNVLQEYGDKDQHGKLVSNHPILTAPGALFGILCIEDDTERERLFEVFWEEGTAHQNSFLHTILPMFGSQGIWPESTSYSFMPNVTMILNIVDRIKPELEVVASNLHILEGNFLFDYLRLPDRRFVTYGDSHRDSDGTEALYRYTLDLANRRGLDSYANKAAGALQKRFEGLGGYQPKAGMSTFGNYAVFTRLLWANPIDEDIINEVSFDKPTVIIEHAGIALQRNYVDEQNELYGLCGIIGGGHYVHSHVTGITMELYGAGYVMCPNAGLPSSVAQRRIPLHEQYFRLYAGNNTVIVNGTSHGLDRGSWKGGANVWQNTAVNVAAEPSHLENPKNEHFSFATQLLNDEVNNVVQQRTLSTIRTSPTTGYYFDLYRSRSLDENKFHDYIYHNIGDEILLVNEDGHHLKFKNTSKYENDIGDQVRSPGWRFFENTQSTEATDLALNIRYDINFDQKYMHQFVPGGVDREYTRALAPPSRDIRNGYSEKKTQVLAVRQEGEAWDRPYVMVYEPSNNQSASVQSVEHLYSDGKIVGAKVTSHVGDQVIVDYVICHDDESQSFKLSEVHLTFEGRFAIARSITSQGQTEIDLYIGEGSYLEFEGESLR